MVRIEKGIAQQYNGGFEFLKTYITCMSVPSLLKPKGYMNTFLFGDLPKGLLVYEGVPFSLLGMTTTITQTMT